MAALGDILEPLGESPKIVGNVEGIDITSLSLNSANVEKGALFFCLPGVSRDGHEFAADAVSAGAVALVVERELDGIDVPQIIVPSSNVAVGLVADTFFGKPTKKLDVFGVTGTNGKTTTTHLLQSMLKAAGLEPGLIGTNGAQVGKKKIDLGHTTPDAIQLQKLFADMVEAGNKSCAMEVSSHALDQGRITGTRFAAVGFTNLTRDHLDYHRSFEGYFQAKRLLFVTAGPEGQHWPAVVNCDHEWGSRIFDELVHAERDEMPVWGYTLNEMSRASVSAEWLLTEKGAKITLESPVGDLTFKSKLRGNFNVENVVCAATMCLIAGIDQKHVQTGLDKLKGVRGRFEPVEEGQPFTVLVDYAHTPDSLEQVLASAKGLIDGDGDLIVVFGCGGDRDTSKRPIMGTVVAEAADIAYLTSDNPRSEDPDAIISQIQRGMRRGAKVVVESDRRKAITDAVECAEPGDVVLIAGKGHEQGQVFADETVPFDDATVAREALATLTV